MNKKITSSLLAAAENNMGTLRREGSIDVNVGVSKYRLDATGVVWLYSKKYRSYVIRGRINIPV